MEVCHVPGPGLRSLSLPWVSQPHAILAGPCPVPSLFLQRISLRPPGELGLRPWTPPLHFALPASTPLCSATVDSADVWFLSCRASFLRFFLLSFCLCLCLCLSFPSPPLPRGLLLPPPAGGLPTPGREGRMVVLSLVLGLSEQDDFANIPDLQNPGTQQNQNAQGDKRYEHRRGPAAAAAEKEAWRGRPPRLAGCWTRRWRLQWMLEREDSPLPSRHPRTQPPGGVPWVRGQCGPPGTILDQACSPGMLALARSKPAFLPHSPACLPSAAPSSFISARPGNPSFPGGWWAGGDVREGAPAYSPSSPPPQPPLAWRSRWGDGHTPRCRGVTGCSAD